MKGDWKRHESDPERQAREAFKDKQVQRLRKLEAEAGKPPAAPKPKPKRQEAKPPPDFPKKPEGMSDDLWNHLFRGPTDGNTKN